MPYIPLRCKRPHAFSELVNKFNICILVGVIKFNICIRIGVDKFNICIRVVVYKFTIHVGVNEIVFFSKRQT